MSLLLNIGEGEPGRLIISGGPLVGELLNTHKAAMLGFYDSSGNLNVVFYRAFTDDMWAMCTRLDEDWQATLLRLNIDQRGQLISLVSELKDGNLVSELKDVGQS